MSWIDNSIEQYYTWLKDKTFVNKSEASGWYVISTPFLGTFNDTIDIYAKLEGDKILLSDDGQTLKNLNLVGVSINRSSKRKEWLDMILLNYGIELEEDELQVFATEKDFPQKKHNLISAISEISDMEMLAKNTIASIFREDVKDFLDDQDIIYTPHFIAKGATGIEFNFDFQIAGKEKEIVIKSFNSLNKINVPNFLFGWDDVRPYREKASGKELTGLAIVNNIDNDVKPEFLEALESKGANVILWDKRYEKSMLDKLVA